MSHEAEGIVGHIESIMGGLIGTTMVGMANAWAASAEHRAGVASNAVACSNARAAVRARFAVRERVALEDDLADALDDADHMRNRLRELNAQVAQLKADNGTLAQAVLRYRIAGARQAA